MGLAVEKGPDAFRTISEVAQDLDLPQHVLRFWETRFAQIKPLKRGGGRRYYRPDDIDLLRGIRQLLYGDGYTIRGVQQILREQGVRHVQAIGRTAEAEQARVGPPAGYPHAAEPRPSGREGGGIGLIDLLPSLRSSRPMPELPRVVEVPVPNRPAPVSDGDDDVPPFPFRRAVSSMQTDAGLRPVASRPVFEEAPAGPPLRMPLAPRGNDMRPSGENMRLSPEAVRLLKATLFELGECRRILDQGMGEQN